MTAVQVRWFISLKLLLPSQTPALFLGWQAGIPCNVTEAAHSPYSTSSVSRVCALVTVRHPGSHSTLTDSEDLQLTRLRSKPVRQTGCHRCRTHWKGEGRL